METRKRELGAVVLMLLGLALAAAAAACGPPAPGDEEPAVPAIPMGTLCWIMNQSETCLTSADVVATRTVTAGNVWFQVRGTLPMTVHDRDGGEVTEDRAFTVFGQIPQRAPLPRWADRVVIEVPAAGACEHTYLVSPFGACETRKVESICDARAVYDEAGAKVTVHALSDAEIVATISATVSLDLPDDCCKDDDQCAQIPAPAGFAPAGPFPLEGRLHAPF